MLDLMFLGWLYSADLIWDHPGKPPRIHIRTIMGTNAAYCVGPEADRIKAEAERDHPQCFVTTITPRQAEQLKDLVKAN